MKNPTKEEIVQYRNELAEMLRTMTNDDGSKVLSDEAVTDYAYGYSDRAMQEYMQDSTPQELADMITM